MCVCVVLGKWQSRVCVIMAEPLTIIEVLEQVLLSREVQVDFDVDGESDRLAWLQRKVRQSLLQIPAQELPKQLLCRKTRKNRLSQ